MTEKIETPVLVIGTGIAGATTALDLADRGIAVTIVTKADNPEESNTRYAQGGINGLARADKDSPELLARDTISAGAGYTGIRAAEILAKEADPYVKEFLGKRVGVKFDGEQTLEGGHHAWRTNKVADHTGAAIEKKLVEAVVSHPNINLLTNSVAIDLLTPNHHSTDPQDQYERPMCVGAYIFNRKTKEVSRCVATKTILATGGAGQVYEHTSNPEGATGDGLAMVQRAGVMLSNLEYVQFHPTTFFHPGAPRFLITEAARGEGARLVNADGKPIAKDPEADRQTRDIVSRMINAEMTRLGTPCVYLDLRSNMSEEKIKEHFPTIRETLLKFGVDITRDLIPVVPAQHFMCGGIWTEAETGRTTLENLYAAGEAAINGGIHGANRLASNSLAAGGIWGRRVAADIAKNLVRSRKIDANKIRPWEYRSAQEVDPASIAQDLKIIRGLMWTYVGLVRSDKGLSRARIELGRMERSVENYYQGGPISENLLALRNIARVATLITEAAWANKTSAGCHFREG